MSSKDNRGGKRPGAGRPKGSSKMYAFRADKNMAEFIDGQNNKTKFIKDCVKKEISFRSLGDIIPAHNIKPISLPYFEIKLVAGFPIPLNNDELAQEIELLSLLCPHPDSSYLIRVTGDSMIEAGINDGDLLIVDKSNRSPSTKQVAVCELNGEYTVKRVMEKGSFYWLIPANPAYSPIKVMDGDEFNVWGVVTYIIHKPLC